MINSLIVSFSVCLTACVVEVGEETSVLTYTDASSLRHQVLNSIPHLNPFTLQLSVMCFRFVLVFFAPHWMRCEFSHHPPDTWRSYRSPGLTDGYIMAKLGGRVEKQCESCISEGNSLCLHGNVRCPVSALFLRAVKKLPPVLQSYSRLLSHCNNTERNVA